MAAKKLEVALPHFQASARIGEILISRESPARTRFPVNTTSLPPLQDVRAGVPVPPPLFA